MKDISVKEVMTFPVISVKRDMSLKELVMILDDNIFSGLPVIDAEEKVIGIISERDVMKYTQWIIGQPLKDPARLLEEDNEATYVTGQRGIDIIELVASATAGTIMTEKVITVKGETSILETVRLMNRKEINRIPVVDDVGKLLGIVTRADILKMLENWADTLA